MKKFLHWFLCIVFFGVYGQLLAHEDELPLVVVIMSYNNAPWVDKNLDSVFCQEYGNFCVVYVDDASSDGTADCVRKYVAQHGLEDRVTLICNSERCRKLKNMYTLFHSLPDDQIIVHIDGDDWLAHPRVLQGINQAHQDENVWFTYSQLRNWPDGRLGVARNVSGKTVKDRSFRKSWIFYPPRSFYPWLFKLIKLQDLLADDVAGFKGQFYPASNDLATVFPMLEMVHTRFKFINDVTYIRNKENPISGFQRGQKRTQLASGKEVFAKSKYPVVQEPVINRLAEFEHAQVQVILFTSDPQQAKATLTDLHQHVDGIQGCCLVYEVSEYAKPEQFQLAARLNGCACIPIQQLPDIQEYLVGQHVLLVSDTDMIDTVDINRCIKELERTFAFGFYIGADPTQIRYCQHLYDTISAWKFKCVQEQACPHINLHMSLYRIQDILEHIATSIQSIALLEQRLHSVKIDRESVGLFFNE